MPGPARKLRQVVCQPRTGGFIHGTVGAEHFVGEQRRDAVEQKHTAGVGRVQRGENVRAALHGLKAPACALGAVAGNARVVLPVVRDHGGQIIVRQARAERFGHVLAEHGFSAF